MSDRAGRRASLADKVALVTGGASGIGRATAERFAREGAAVVVADVHDERGAELVRSIREVGGRAAYAHTDVRSAADVEAAVLLATTQFGGLDICVANAGIAGPATFKPLEAVTEEEWEVGLDVNLSGVWRTFKHAAPAIRAAGGGSMACTSSISGVVVLGNAGLGAYTVSKTGAVALSAYFASELAADGIRVNCVSPGGVHTNIAESYSGPRPASAPDISETAGRPRTVADADEIAAVHHFLATEEASFMSGANIVVDNGRTTWLR